MRRGEVMVLADPTQLSARRRWTMLICALVTALTTTCIVSGFAYLIPALHTDAGLSLTEASTLAAIPTVGLMVAIMGWGILLDRYGERRILIISLSISLVGATAAAIAATFHTSYLVLAACLLVGGIGSGAANGASGRIVVGWFPPQQRGTAMGIRQMAQPLGIGLSALTMPVTAAHLGIGAALAIPAAVTAIGLAATVFGIRDPHRLASPDAGTPRAERRNPYRESSYLLRIHTLSVLLVIPQTMLWTFVPTWLIVAHGWAPTSAGILITVTQVVGALGRIVAGRWSDVWGSRTRPLRLIAAGVTLTMGALALTDWVHSPIAVGMMVAASIISVSPNGLAFTAIAEYAGTDWSGRGLAVQNTGQYLATAATTPLFGALIAALGFPFAFGVAALTPLVAIPLTPRDPVTDPPSFEPVSR